MFIAKLLFRTLVLAVLFSCSVFAHECGHYVFVRAAGVGVEEICIGEGPVIIEGTLPDGAVFRFRSIPFSGFVLPNQDYFRRNRPSVALELGMYGSGICATTVLSCLLFMAFACLTGIAFGFRQALWFGIRRTIVTLLLFPWLWAYGVITFKAYKLLRESVHMRILSAYLLNRPVMCGRDETAARMVKPWPHLWLGSAAVMLFLCSLIGLFPLGEDSDPTMMMMIVTSRLESVLPFGSYLLIMIWELFLASLFITFTLQTALITAVALFGAKAKREKSGHGDADEKDTK